MAELRLSRALALGVALALLVSCNATTARVEGEGQGPPLRRAEVDRAGLPLARLTELELERFQQGDALFEATVRESDGLGPLYVRDACSACHASDGRGPGVVTKAFVESGDATIAAKLLPFGPTERPYTTAGATRPLLAPTDPLLRKVPRLPPAVFGRGYLEAVADYEIERLATLAQARAGSARGKLQRLPDGTIGRFGVKARLATLFDFTADALNGDMGITSPSRPEEPPGPEGLRDDAKPGVDFTHEQVALLSDYVRALDLPVRHPPDARGSELFDSTGCRVCHVRSLATDPEYSLATLARREVQVYTDFLLHDMGEAFSDGVTENAAGPREFRTAPLIGLRFLPSLLHDGRARTVEAAILAHGEPDSEARDSAASFRALSAAERAALVAFVETL